MALGLLSARSARFRVLRHRSERQVLRGGSGTPEEAHVAAERRTLKRRMRPVGSPIGAPRGRGVGRCDRPPASQPRHRRRQRPPRDTQSRLVWRRYEGRAGLAQAGPPPMDSPSPPCATPLCWSWPPSSPPPSWPTCSASAPAVRSAGPRRPAGSGPATPAPEPAMIDGVDRAPNAMKGPQGTLRAFHRESS